MLAMQSMSMSNEVGASHPPFSQEMSIFPNKGLKPLVHLSVMSLYSGFMREGDLGQTLSI